MKRIILLFTIIGLCLSVQAQQKNTKHSEEEFRMKKEAYLTKHAELTQEEAQHFFPLYYELQKKKKEITGVAWERAKKDKELQATEEEYENILKGILEAEKETNALDQEYLKKYQAVLSNKKIFMLLKAEIKFQRNMLKVMQQPTETKK